MRVDVTRTNVHCAIESIEPTALIRINVAVIDLNHSTTNGEATTFLWYQGQLPLGIGDAHPQKVFS